METKKTKKADLKSKQSMFLQIGFVIALALVFSAFQWATPNKSEIILSGGMDIDYEPELIPITRTEDPKLKDVVKKKALKLDIIEGPVEIDEPIIDFTSEGGEGIYVEPIILEPEPEEMIADTFYIVEDMPVFPGGDKALLQYIAKETKYPNLAKANGVQGRVFIGFIINKQGKVQDAKVIRSADALLDKEALRVVSKMPNWQAGKQRGKAVNVSFVVPISFRLQ